METFNAACFAGEDLPAEFLQDNHSSSRKGVVRGLHYQLEPAQGKLVRCTRGTIFDVAVDIRRNSPTFRKWAGVRLSARNRLMLWIPAGFAHGFSALTDRVEVVYKCTTLWNPENERTIIWNDPEIGIDWQVAEPIVSPKDTRGVPLRDAEVFENVRAIS